MKKVVYPFSVKNLWDTICNNLIFDIRSYVKNYFEDKIIHFF
jgi:hypothetical protein